MPRPNAAIGNTLEQLSYATNSFPICRLTRLPNSAHRAARTNRAPAAVRTACRPQRSLSSSRAPAAAIVKFELRGSHRFWNAHTPLLPNVGRHALRDLTYSLYLRLLPFNSKFYLVISISLRAREQNGEDGRVPAIATSPRDFSMPHITTILHSSTVGFRIKFRIEWYARGADRREGRGLPGVSFFTH
ncbi:hypothetical protein M407DRAFT_163912 [Tulasnella calospora MUT 4182]|uniref:Uncharacterized protein n=1 Tax=Tulasnella calospora MUT 4182 TaxID=1051891 RepID=A0A0C3Q4X4_9AGAM|nr:hypothetical protein M407DRAFT_163912 [Tulasnella calospora MUT 4182]